MIRFVPLSVLLLGSAFLTGCGTSASDNPLISRPQSVAWNVDQKIPDAVRAPHGHVLLGHAIGRGVATFTLQADPNDPNGRRWVVSNDEGGDLLDDDGYRVGRHQGDIWSFRNGTSITAEPVAMVPMMHHMPWALMASTSHSGHDSLGSTEFVEQIHTVGGPPASGTGADIGTQVRAQYSADYYFFGPMAASTRSERGTFRQ